MFRDYRPFSSFKCTILSGFGKSFFRPTKFFISSIGIISASLFFHHNIHSKEPTENSSFESTEYPIEQAILTKAPKVPPPITRNYPVILQAKFTFKTIRGMLTRGLKYDFWTINDTVPGPMLRARVGDIMEVTVVNEDTVSSIPHNLDFHAVMGPGGGSPLLNANVHQTKTARFKLMSPGCFIYHCAMAPMPLHIANGMYGLVLVEPEGGLEKVDQEYYVMQSEFYYNSTGNVGDDEETVECAYDRGLKEEPNAVVFNGREDALTGKDMLKAKTGDRIRIFFGNAGPNLISSFHIIGTTFDKVYREGDLISLPARCIQTTLVPSGGAAVVEFQPLVPGIYTLSDHSIFRIDKGATGFVNVIGEKRNDLYYSKEEPEPCVGCKTHP